MKIDVVFTANELENRDLNNKTGVAIDVLRATTVAVIAFENGCSSILHTPSLEVARKIAEQSENGKIILGGERQGLKPQGFDLSNSPYDYKKEIVSGKDIIFTSSNGSKAIHGLKKSNDTICASFLNVSAVCNEIIKLNANLLIVCAGDFGTFSLGDTVCAGMIIDILEKKMAEELEFTDTAIVAKILYGIHKVNIKKMLLNSDWGKHLIKIGMGRDIDICATVDSSNLVPKLNNDALTIA